MDNIVLGRAEGGIGIRSRPTTVVRISFQDGAWHLSEEGAGRVGGISGRCRRRWLSHGTNGAALPEALYLNAMVRHSMESPSARFRRPTALAFRLGAIPVRIHLN